MASGTRSDRTRAAQPVKHRSFDPRRVGSLECEAWVAYYRRDWLTLWRASLWLTRHTFGLPWAATVPGAWLVLLANQLWAPYPDNDPDGARRAMERFYSLVKVHHGERFDPRAAARLEVSWWRVHRERQHIDSADDEEPLMAALAALYAYVYGVHEEDLQVAATQRALAMRYSDQWVQEGCDLASPLIGQERAALGARTQDCWRPSTRPSYLQRQKGAARHRLEDDVVRLAASLKSRLVNRSFRSSSRQHLIGPRLSVQPE